MFGLLIKLNISVMATPHALEDLNSNSCVLRRSKRKLRSNAGDNEMSDNNQHTTRFQLPTLHVVSSDSLVFTRSRSRNLKSIAGDCEMSGDSRDSKSSIRRKKITVIKRDSSECSTVLPKDEEPLPEGLGKEAECLTPNPSFKKSQDSKCIEDEAGKTGYSPVHFENERQSSTTVDQKDHVATERQESPSSTSVQSAQDYNYVGECIIEKGCSSHQSATERKELPSSTVNENDLKTSAKRLDASKPVLATPHKRATGTPPKVISATKLPNFASIHKKQFEKMESVVEWKQRKQIRSDRMLMSPTAKSTFCLKRPEPSPLTENVFNFTATQKSIENKGVPDSSTMKKAPLSLEDMKKFRSRQNINTAQAKESVIKKLPLVSREEKRAQERTYLKGVRLNKRFHLQMGMRKLC